MFKSCFENASEVLCGYLYILTWSRPPVKWRLRPRWWSPPRNCWSHLRRNRSPSRAEISLQKYSIPNPLRNTRGPALNHKIVLRQKPSAKCCTPTSPILSRTSVSTEPYVKFLVMLIAAHLMFEWLASQCISTDSEHRRQEKVRFCGHEGSVKDVSSTLLVKFTNKLEKNEKTVFKNLESTKNYSIWLNKQSKLVYSQ